MDLRNIKEFTKDFIKIAIVVIIVFCVYMFIISMQQVVGSSMNNTLNNGDLVLLFKAKYKFSDVKRFDVVSFNYEDTKYLIKRVIGLPGEHIEYKDNKLYINGNYVEEERDFETDDFKLEDLGYEVIPDDMYFVLGDNRENSLDSREIGLIKKEDIIGKVIFRLWPINGIKLIR